VLFKHTVILKQYKPKKHKRVWKKLYKLCDSKGYTHNMIMYLGKDYFYDSYMCNCNTTCCKD